MKKSGLKKIKTYFTITAIFIAIAFAVKYSVLYCIDNQINTQNEFVDLIFVRNTGAAFSLFATHTDTLVFLSTIVLIAIVAYIVRKANRLSHLRLNSLAILTAGICGNLYERIFDGYVTDYISLKFYNFPVFNVFDVLISIGALFLIIAIYKEK